MNTDEEKIISETESLCPICLKKIQARRVLIEEDIFLVKNCSEHGEFRTIIWKGLTSYKRWQRSTENSPPKASFTDKNKGCPFDCGVCPQHEQQACCVLLELTQRCNQNCEFCFADANAIPSMEPTLDEIKEWYELLMMAGEERPFNIQLSGGEPTVRDDLSEIIRIGKNIGFPYIQLNTNGKRLAEDIDYVQRLKDAGLSAVFLQFDGTEDGIYQKLRGERLLDLKRKAVENCAKNMLGVVLVPTLVPNVNVHNIGEMIQYAINNLPHIRGVHFQPVSFFGRYPESPKDSDRITIPEVINEIEKQTGGLIKMKDLLPLQSGHTLCSFNGSFVYQEDGSVVSLAKEELNSMDKSDKKEEAIIKARNFIAKKWTREEKKSCCSTGKDYDFSGWDLFMSRIQTHGFSITAMGFQDVWNLDLERLKKCRVHVMSKDKKLIPFCAYNLTDSKGNSLYRRKS